MSKIHARKEYEKTPTTMASSNNPTPKYLDQSKNKLFCTGQNDTIECVSRCTYSLSDLLSCLEGLVANYPTQDIGTHWCTLFIFSDIWNIVSSVDFIRFQHAAEENTKAKLPKNALANLL